MSLLLSEINRLRDARDSERHQDQDMARPYPPAASHGGGNGTHDDYSSASVPPQQPGQVPEDVNYPAYQIDWNWNGAVTTKGLSPARFSDALTYASGYCEAHSHQGVIGQRHHALVLRGLPEEYVDILLKHPRLGMRSSFLAAHAQRRGHHSNARWFRKDLRVEQWVYPELFEGFTPATTSTTQRDQGRFGKDLMADPTIYPIDADSSFILCPAYDCWLDFFDVYDMLQFHESRPTSSIDSIGQILRSLDQNGRMFTNIKRFWAFQEIPDVTTSVIGYVDWAGLSSETLRELVNVSKLPKWNARTGNARPKAEYLLSKKRQREDDLDENHRALDRVSYLGGILIPLPIVSGILSMGEDFGPGGPKFFIFWAVSIPLSVLTFLIIYADTLRRSEVWVEVFAEHAAALPVPTEASEKQYSSQRKRAGDGGIAHIQDEEAQISAGFPGPMLFGISAVTAQDDPRVGFGELGAGKVTAPQAGPEMEQELPDMILENPVDGRKQRAWRRKKLGWGGAAKAILYRKPHYCHKGKPEGVPAYDRRDRRTRTF
ncbi:hypothetical protein OQA88_12319 [Cercophora sp. LCS_1]